jgi:hypothetical protein
MTPRSWTALRASRAATRTSRIGLSVQNRWERSVGLASHGVLFLAALGPGALIDLQRVLEGSPDYRREVLVALMEGPAYTDLATLIATADTDEVVRLRLLRAIRGLGLGRKESSS